MENPNPNKPRPYKEPFFNEEMPLGLGMALVQNSSALDRFSRLTESEKHDLINSVHGITSKEEMRSFVEAFAGGDDAKRIF